MWEDENCQDGGRWVLRVPKTHANLYWEDLVLAMIGEQFTDENEILGMIIAVKPSYSNISIWHRHGNDEAIMERIKADVEKFVKLEKGMQLSHEKFKKLEKNEEQEASQKKSWVKGESKGRGRRQQVPESDF